MNIERILSIMPNVSTVQRTELGDFLVQWRKQHNLSMRAAGEIIGIASSSLSDLEKGKRRADIETLFAISEATGIPLDQVAVKAGYESKRSMSAQHRADRLVAMTETMPQFAPIVDALPTFGPEELDTVLTVVEVILQRRQAQAKKAQ